MKNLKITAGQGRTSKIRQVYKFNDTMTLFTSHNLLNSVDISTRWSTHLSKKFNNNILFHLKTLWSLSIIKIQVFKKKEEIFSGLSFLIIPIRCEISQINSFDYFQIIGIQFYYCDKCFSEPFVKLYVNWSNN